MKGLLQKAIECLKRADIVLYDRLLNPFFLSYTKQTCELMYCGKMPKNHIMRQEIINAHLLQFAKEGKIVVRLKGGDPSIFGRVGEEAETLAAEIFHMKLYQALHLASPLVAMQVFPHPP